MGQRYSTWIVLFLLAILFFSATFLSNRVFHSLRLDLTQSQIYSLSDGTLSLLADIEETIHITFFFSEAASEDFPSLRLYGARVKSLLKEYQAASQGKLIIDWVDPEPFTESEDKAVALGLTGVALSARSDPIYFGMHARNALDDTRVIPFFDLQKERLLEYDISKVLYQLSTKEKITLGVLSSTNLAGGQHYLNGEQGDLSMAGFAMDERSINKEENEAPWHIYTLLNDLYHVELLSEDDSAIPDNIDVLLLVHPKALSESMRYAIDQFVLSGKGLVAFIDPHFESETIMALEHGFEQELDKSGAASSIIESVFLPWGIAADLAHVVLDPINGLEVNTFTGPVQHAGLIGLGRGNIEQSDTASSYLELINGGSFGHLQKSDTSQLQMLPILTSSDVSSLASSADYATRYEPQAIAELISSDANPYVLGARFTGNAHSGFSLEGNERRKNAQQHIAQGNINVAVFADVDMLTNHFWAEESQQYSETLFTPFADNGDLVTNLIEHLGGSQALMGIRGRGISSRPFTKVDSLRVAAQKRYREKEWELEQKLRNVESQLLDLESQPDDPGGLVLSEEQSKAIQAFNLQRVEIRKALRDVRHQLEKDITFLGTWLKLINVVFAPLLLITILALVMRVVFVVQHRKRNT